MVSLMLDWVWVPVTRAEMQGGHSSFDGVNNDPQLRVLYRLRWYEVCTVPTTCNPHHMPGHKKTNLNCVDFIRLQLNVDQSVMVNYNPDCPQQRGFWYEAIVTRKLERERKVFCKLLLG